MALVAKIITKKEETIFVTKEDITKVENVMSFESKCPVGVSWSTIPFSEKNMGGDACRFGERVFSKAHTIYFKPDRDCWIHIRTGNPANNPPPGEDAPVITARVIDITTTSAKLEINAEPATELHVYDWNNQELTSYILKNLAKNTNYQFRAVAKNGSTQTQKIITFNTKDA